MKQMKWMVLFVAAAIIAGCGGKGADEESFVIKGNFTNTKKDSIYLYELTVSKMLPVDSAVISEDGDFYFKITPENIGFYVLKMGSDNFVTLLVDKNETVEITADARQMLYTYKVSGSAGSELI